MLVQPVGRLLAFLLIGFQVGLEFRICQLEPLDNLFLRCVDYFDLGDRMEAALLERLHPAPHLSYRFLNRDSPSIYCDGFRHPTWKRPPPT